MTFVPAFPDVPGTFRSRVPMCSGNVPFPVPAPLKGAEREQRNSDTTLGATAATDPACHNSGISSSLCSPKSRGIEGRERMQSERISARVIAAHGPMHGPIALQPQRFAAESRASKWVANALPALEVPA